MKVFIRGGVKAEVAAVVGMTLIAVLAVAVLVTTGVRWFSGQQQEHAPATRSVSPKTYESGLESVAPITESVSPQNMFTDNRDGQTYKTATIGEQIWMAQNLNYQTASGSWCYENNSSNCYTYGRLYDFHTARTVCPAGWHLPSAAEWDNLASAVGGTRKKYKDNETGNDFFGWAGVGTKLKARSGWNNNGNGMDDYGFSALPGGFRFSDGGFYGADSYGVWWTASEDGVGNAYYRGMEYDYDYVDEHSYDKSGGLSVRCVQD